MATVTKKDLVIAITDQTGITHQQANALLETTFAVITSRLRQGDSVALRGFGTFAVRTAKAKKGRNPRDPTTEIDIPARAVLRFKPASELRASIRDLPQE
jgi:nucleoid DNA-binding protein